MMLSSLRSRLLVLVVTVGVVAIGATAAIAQQVATEDLRATLERRVQTRTEVIDQLEVQVMIDGSVEGLNAAVERLAAYYGERVAVYDEQERAIADSDPEAELPAQPAGVISSSFAMNVEVDDAVLQECQAQSLVDEEPAEGELLVAVDDPEFIACLDASLTSSGVGTAWLVFVGTGSGDAASVLGPNGPNRRLVGVSLIVLLASVAVMALALRSVLAPIGALRRGARRLGGGDLDTRVPETGASELVELARSFNSMAAALQDDKERQQRWTSDTAHELRNPVQNLRGHLEAAKDGLMTPDERWLDSVLDEVGQLGYLVSDLAVLTLSDAGRIDLDIERVDLRSLIDDVVTSHQPRAAHAGVTLTATGAASADVDERRLRQAVSNLVDNALRHTPNGGSVTVDVGPSESKPTDSGPTDSGPTDSGPVSGIVLTVTDTGDGIPADAQERIFDRFARVDEHRARHAGGSGLGLSIVAALVEAHGGEVSVDSEVGVGTTFRIALPATMDRGDNVAIGGAQVSEAPVELG